MSKVLFFENFDVFLLFSMILCSTSYILVETRGLAEKIHFFQATKIQNPSKKVSKNQNFKNIKFLTLKNVYTVMPTKYEVSRTIELRYLA